MRSAVVFLILATVAAVSTAGAAVRANRSPLDGRWTWTWTRADVLRTSGPGYDEKTLVGPETLVFANGRYHARNLRSGRRDDGRFTVTADVVRFFPETGPEVASGVAMMRYSLFRDRLTWMMVPGRHGWNLLTTTPWTRAR